MRPTPRLLVAIGALTGVLSASPATPQIGDPPGPIRGQQEELYAVALELGALHRQADVGSEELREFRRGAVFDYLGPATDTFGRDWTAVGDGDGWVRAEDWYAVAATPAEVAGRTGTISALTVLPAPQNSVVTATTSEDAAAQIAAARMPIEVPPDWWSKNTRVDAAAIGQFGRVVGVPARIVTPAVASELLDLLGGREVLGPFPEEGEFGALFVAPRTGMVFRHDGDDWRLMEPVLTMRDHVGLLANPELAFDPDAPPEPTGPSIACWSLVGGLGPRGEVVGTVAGAPPPPSRLTGASRPDSERYLGYYDLTPRAWPTVIPSMQAPRRVVPEDLTSGVLLNDTSRRQAAYLQQQLPPEVTQRLRGREIRITVLARAAVSVSPTATVGVDVEAGSLRQFSSVQVGPMPTPIEMLVTVPADAEVLTLRILPNDLSIVVTETGTAVIDSATILPAEWPTTLEPAPLLLRRARAVTYRPARRYTRARVVITNRSRFEIARIMRGSEGIPDDRLEKILSGEVEVDMTQRQVQLAWGEPREREEGGLTVWRWRDRSASFDVDGRLIAWTQQPEPEPARPSMCGLPSGGLE